MEEKIVFGNERINQGIVDNPISKRRTLKKRQMIVYRRIVPASCIPYILLFFSFLCSSLNQRSLQTAYLSRHVEIMYPIMKFILNLYFIHKKISMS